MRCPQCGARNSDDAVWCTQCYADVRGQREEPELPDDLLGGTPMGETGATAAVEETADPATSEGERSVREREGRIEWWCPACDGWTELERPTCRVCGTSRRGFGEQPLAAARTDLSEAGILGASLLLPGLGHVLAGRSGTGLARAILAILWLLGGLALIVGSSGLGTLPGWVLLLGAVVLWVATAFDARALAGGGSDELLGPRRLGLLVLVVTVALVATAAIVFLGRA